MITLITLLPLPNQIERLFPLFEFEPISGQSLDIDLATRNQIDRSRITARSVQNRSSNMDIPSTNSRDGEINILLRYQYVSSTFTVITLTSPPMPACT
jgi:hypothetical protein